MHPQHDERLRRARCALEGLSVGDAFGGPYEMVSQKTIERRAKVRWLPEAPWRFTDDTNMALSIYVILRQRGEIDQDALAQSFAENYERGRGYGPGARHILRQIRHGQPWRKAAQSVFAGTGSYGNGAAMRVAPVGAYFADDLNAMAEQARRSAEVTHIHPEGIAGAIAVAAATAWAWRLRGGPAPARADFINYVLPSIPESDVRKGVICARDLPPDTPVEAAVQALGNGSRVSCQDTVPFVLWCAGERLGHYEEAIWLTASGGGDVDTTCAMVGGTVAMYTGEMGIPAGWVSCREPLPAWAVE
jgi:ADP-ribosylglycohydrolase